jgi:phosphopantothenoylcysteine decarboxylase/phosphopantothenate--cysteine ligase
VSDGGAPRTDPEAPLVLLGVSGSVAAYRAAELVRGLGRAGLRVQVVLTRAAEAFVGPDLFAALSRRPVLRDDEATRGDYPHLEASREAAVLCVAPCTANTLAELAHGLAGSVLAQSALACTAPLVLAPAMNVRMWQHPATQANVALLRARGAHVVGPDEGALAEGEWGAGRMSEPAVIQAAIEDLIAPRRAPPVRGQSRLAGRTVLVTAGGTREPLDGVRFLGNRSSGRMGAALAEEAAGRGADVVTVLANGTVRPGAGEVVEVETTEQLEREVLARGGADVVLMAAAVADFRPVERDAGKRSREGGWRLELEPTTDIAAALGRARRPGQVLVGFAAEVGADGRARAREKLERKGLDLIVLNDVARADIGFDVAENEVELITPGAVDAVPKASKRLVARAILDRVETLLGGA